MSTNKRIEDTLEKIAVTLSSQHITLTKNSRDIKHHIKRTDKLEGKLNSWQHKASLYMSLATGATMLVKTVIGLFY